MIKSLRTSALCVVAVLLMVPHVFTVQSEGADGPNILIIIADDMGVDTLSSYGLTDDAAATPNLDALAKDGVLFENAWATPACSTTRAAMLTGRHGSRNGVTSVPGVLPDGSRILHAEAGDAGYANAAFGKWHLAARSASPDHPNTFEIDHYVGNAEHNLSDYFSWDVITNGVVTQTDVYHTTRITDETIKWIRAQRKPWLAWVAYSAPHAPFHLPPKNLHSRKLSGTKDDINRNRRAYFLAAIEAMDHEIGRLLDAMPDAERDNTLIVFLGDNGTPRSTIDRRVFPAQHGKSSLYEGGIRVPFIVAGKGVSARGRSSRALINIVDVYPTLAELFFGLDSTDTDGVSFAPVLANRRGERTVNYAEYDGGWTVRDATHKLVRQSSGIEELYAIAGVNDETENLISDRTLASKLASLRGHVQATANISSPSQETSRAMASAETVNETSTSFDCADFVGRFEATGRDVATGKEYMSELTMTASAEKCVFLSNSIPNHAFNDGRRPFPNAVKPVTRAYSVPRAPKRASSVTPLSLRYDTAVMLNGVKVDLIAAGCHGVGDGKIGCNDMTTPWRFNPLFEASGFNTDSHHAHTQRDGAYHYHGAPPAVVSAADDQDGVIGFAADGFPIMAYVRSAAGVKRSARSSYRLKRGSRPGGSSGPGGVYDGTYLDDFEYVAGTGDLDRCNGATIDGRYAYYVTETFPYVLGCFAGTPDRSFAKAGAAQGERRDRRGDRERTRGREKGSRRGDRRRRR
ncbi:MAG: sulfatase-like hydrolase/transferase [Pseudomonadota bacterium]